MCPFFSRQTTSTFIKIKAWSKYLLYFQVLDESHQKYKFMEKNLMARRRKLKSQVPDINSSLAMLKKLKSKNEEGEEAETQFLLSDQVYAKATIPPTEKVRSWAELLKGDLSYLEFG